MQRSRVLKHWPLLIIIGVFLLAKLFVLFLPQSLIWDEAVYVGMGKYIWRHGTVGLWEQFRPPLVPLVLGMFWKLGLDPLFWGELFMLACSVGLIITTYLLGLQHSKRVATIAATFLVATPIFFLYSSYLMTHMPSMLLVTTAMLVPSSWAKGALSTLAALVRFPVGLALFFHKWKWQLFIAAGLVSVPFFFVNYAVYKDDTGTAFDAMTRPLQLAAEHQDNPWEFVQEKGLYYVLLLANQIPLLLLFLPLGIWLGWRTQTFRFFAGFVIYYHLIPNRQDRFILEFLPFMCILAALGIVWYLKKVKHNRYVVGFLILTLLAPILFSVGTMGWRINERPEMGFYTYFDDHPPEEAVLAANPVPAAYSDALFIPYYFYADEKPAILNRWERKVDVSHVTWASNAFPCADKECQDRTDKLYAHISKGEQVYSESYPGKKGDVSYEIFTY